MTRRRPFSWLRLADPGWAGLGVAGVVDVAGVADPGQADGREATHRGQRPRLHSIPRPHPESRLRRLGLAACLLLAAPVFAGATGEAERTLTNGVIEVRVMDPVHPERFNRGVRFTPLAAVLGVTRDGVEYLYSPANHDPRHDHAGLAAEFDLCIPGGPKSDFPSGYAEAAVGEGFLKIGVGALKKSARPYNFFQTPELLETARTTVEWREDGARYRQELSGAETPGYAYRLEAGLSLDGPSVTVEWRLANTGAKPITTRQYTHNFFRIENYDTDSGYELAFPYAFQARGLEDGQTQVGRAIRFDGSIPRWINAVVPWPETFAGPNTLTLRHPEARRGIICETSLPGLRTDIHARAAYIAPEQFIEITVPPGETQTWTRRYTFEQDDGVSDVAGVADPGQADGQAPTAPGSATPATSTTPATPRPAREPHDS